MAVPRASDAAADQRLPWWLRRQVGWALLVLLAAVLLDTTLQVASVEVAHRSAQEVRADRPEPAVSAAPVSAVPMSAVPMSATVVRRSDPTARGDALRDPLERVPTERRAEQVSRTQRAAQAEARKREQREAERVARVTLRRELRADRQLAALLSALAEAPDGWVSPVSGSYRITATFGAHGSMWSNTHTGVDLAAPTGTPVRAVAAGTVVFAAENGAYGLRVAVRHEDGAETWYAHLSRLSVTEGQHVAQGAPIGAIGATGNVTGPHLHLELRPGGGDPVDPVGGLRNRGAVL